MIARLRPKRRRDDGASAVELALVLPILLALVFGIISFGTLFAQQLALNNGVRQGARLAVVEGSDAGEKSCAGVVSAVRDSTGPAIAMDTSTIDVQVVRSESTTPCGTGLNPTSSSPAVCTNSILPDNSQQSIVVTGQYQADLLIPMPIPGFPSQFDLEAKAVYKCEFN